MSNTKTEKRIQRHKRVRSKISGTSIVPRLSVFKSNSNLIAQLINDEKGETLAYVSTLKIEGKNLKEKSINLGKEIAEKAKSQKIEKVVFDRGGFAFIGNIKFFADSAREAGLKF